MILLYRILAQIQIEEGDLKIPKPDLLDPVNAQSSVGTALELAFGILGSAAFVVMVIAGMRFVLSRGNPDGIAKARNTIVYSAVGLIISMLSFAIVRFVLRKFIA